MARSIVSFSPAAACAFLATGLSIATTVAIVATAAFFGLIHAFNDHKNSRIQAVMASIGGIVLGVTAAQYGLAAAIAAHIVNNTLAMILLNLRDRLPTSTFEARLEFAAVRA